MSNGESANASRFRRAYNESKRLITSHWWDFFFAIPACALFSLIYSDYIIAGIGLGFLLLVLAGAVSFKPETSDLPVTVLLFIGACLIFSDVFIGADEPLINSILKALFAAALMVYLILELVCLIRYIKERATPKSATQYIDQDINPKFSRIEELLTDLDSGQRLRLERLLKSHALYTDEGHLETVLDSLGKQPAEVKWAMARMVSQALSKVFIGESHFEVANQKYQDFSDIFDKSLVHCQLVWLTSKYAPSKWFEYLKEDEEGRRSGYWSRLPEVKLNDLDQERLKMLSNDETDIYMYPNHYRSFLKVDIPVRIFLLDNTQWDVLKADKDAFEKFMRPCESHNNLLTYFVNTPTFEDFVFNSSNPVKNNPFLESKHGHLHELDLNIFEKQACMIWDSKNTIRFILSGFELDAYVTLFEYILKNAQTLGQTAGIYTTNEIRNQIDGTGAA